MIRVAVAAFRPAHAGAVLDLIGSVFAEYGMAFEPSGYDADLTDIPRHYAGRGGWFGVLEGPEGVVGTVAVVPRDAETCEVKRLYLHPAYRGRGHGAALMDHILDWARVRGFRTMVAWSDARLTRAHVMYERLGFERSGERITDDLDRSLEYRFARAISP